MRCWYWGEVMAEWSALGANGNPQPRYAHIIGWGKAVPERVMTNEELEALVSTNDAWIRARTGIEQRRIANDKETTATLGFKAAQDALNVANIIPKELDLIICCTSTPENVFPASASLIQGWLGASKAGAFDLSAACSGFVYGVQMAAQAIVGGSADNVLVVGAETMSRVMDWQDRGTCILFGDGAGAIVLRTSERPGGVLSGVLRSDGTGGDLLGIPNIASMGVSNPDIFTQAHKPYKMHMKGSEVFKFATRVIGACVEESLQKASVALQDVALIIPHQANLRIIKAAARSLQIEESRFMCNLADYGNTSAASIPIAICDAVEKGRIQNGDHIVLVGFGGGLTWGAVTLRWGTLSQKPTIRLTKQRRELGYLLVRWRMRYRNWLSIWRSLWQRSRPKRGRVERLRSRIDMYQDNDTPPFA